MTATTVREDIDARPKPEPIIAAQQLATLTTLTRLISADAEIVSMAAQPGWGSSPQVHLDVRSAVLLADALGAGLPRILPGEDTLHWWWTARVDSNPVRIIALTDMPPVAGDDRADVPVEQEGQPRPGAPEVLCGADIGFYRDDEGTEHPVRCVQVGQHAEHVPAWPFGGDL